MPQYNILLSIVDASGHVEELFACRLDRGLSRASHVRAFHLLVEQLFQSQSSSKVCLCLSHFSVHHADDCAVCARGLTPFVLPLVHEDIPTIVIDCGSNTIKIGYGGEDAPLVIFSSVVGRVRR